MTDRWHLLKNLSDAFVSILDRFTTTVRTLTRQLNVSTAVSKISETIRAHPEEAQAVVRSASGERRDILFKEALALKAAGHSIQAIATTIGVERKPCGAGFSGAMHHHGKGRFRHAAYSCLTQPTWKRDGPKDVAIVVSYGGNSWSRALQDNMAPSGNGW